MALQSSLAKLPSEIVLEIASYPAIRDLKGFVQTTRRYNTLLSPELYKAGAALLEDDRTPLIWAAQNVWLNAARRLLEQGPIVDRFGTTALHEVIKWNDVVALRFIFAWNTSSFPSNGNGITPLILAVLYRESKMVRVLRAAGAMISCSNPDEWANAIKSAVYEKDQSA
ncbi:hypothetical protein BJX64DRAFT_209034 [Aspergillus heterothallicus]